MCRESPTRFRPSSRTAVATVVSMLMTGSTETLSNASVQKCPAIDVTATELALAVPVPAAPEWVVD